MISVIIPVLNNIELTKQIIQEIKTKTKGDYEIIIIDSMSDDGTEFLMEQLMWDKLPNFTYYRSKENLWVNWAWNKWVELAKGEHIAILNNDLLLCKDWDEKLIAWLEDHKLSSPIYTVWDDAWEWERYKHNRYQPANICGHCYVMRRSDRQPIPEEIKIRYWDNFIHHYIMGNQKCVEECLIHHYESKTVSWEDFTDLVHQQIIADKLAWVWLKKALDIK